MPLRTVVVLASMALVGSIGACTTTTVVTPPADADAGSEEPPVAQIAEKDAGASECSLADDSLSGRATCDACLKKSCCVAIETCLSDEPCLTMNDCMNDCRVEHGSGAVAEACVRDCAAKDPSAAEELLDMLDCQADRCGTACKA